MRTTAVLGGGDGKVSDEQVLLGGVAPEDHVRGEIEHAALGDRSDPLRGRDASDGVLTVDRDVQLFVASLADIGYYPYVLDRAEYETLRESDSGERQDEIFI